MMKKIILLGLVALSLSACDTKQEPSVEAKSNFKDSAECQKHLREIVKSSFNLRGIPTSALKFNVFAKTDNEERIQIDALKNEVTDARPIGQFRVLKSEKKIFDSTFDETNLIEVNLKNHGNVIDICFPKS